MRFCLALLFAFCLIPNFARADASVQAQKMLDYFSSGCPSEGEWTKIALGYAGSLVDVVKSVASDPDCQGINGALGQIQNISTTLSLLSQDENQKQILALKQQEQQALFAISQNPDPTYQKTAFASLEQIELQLSQYESFQSSDNSFHQTQRQGDALSTLVNGTNLLLKQASANQVCIDKNTQLLSGIAGLAGSVGAVAMTGGASLALAAGVDIMNYTVESVRQNHLNDIINHMASSITSQAYQCVLESLSNQFCSAEDALQMIQFQGNAVTHPDDPSPLAQGIGLLGEDVPRFLGWLDTVRAGTKPANQATAQQQAQALEDDKEVRSNRAIVQGLIAERQPLFDQEKDPNQQWKIERAVIIKILSALQGSQNCYGPCSPNSNPFNDTVDTYAQGYYLVGLKDVAQIPKFQGAPFPFDSFDPFSQWPLTTPFKPSFADLSKNLFGSDGQGGWFKLARDRVDLELGRVMNLDPLKVLTDSVTLNIRSESPYHSLVTILAYLKALPPPPSAYGSYQRIYQDTLDRLVEVKTAIEATVGDDRTGKPLLADPVAELGSITSAAVLDNGIGFLSDRIKWAIRIQLNQILLSGKSGVSDTIAAQILASEDVVNDLELFSGTDDVNAIALDIKNSQGVIERTLKNFIDEFNIGIAQSIYDYEDLSSQLGEGDDATQVNNQSVAKMCTLMLAAPAWPGDVDQGVLPRNVCYGRYIPSIFKDGPQSAKITEDLMNAPFKKRICAFRDYNRANLLFRSFEGRTPIKPSSR